MPPGRFARFFGQQRWYAPQPRVSEADLPTVARENLRWIEERLGRCDEDGSRLSADEQRLVDDWFDANYLGRAPLAARLYDNCQAISPSEFRSRTQTGASFGYSPRTPVVRTEETGCAEIPLPPGGHVLSVSVGAWLTAERCQECEGHQILQLVVDSDGKVVALALVMTG